MEKISKSKDVAEDKLLILYVLGKMKAAVSSIELTNYVLEERLMSFVMFRQRINELISANHIDSVSADGVTLYNITARGSKLLSQMSDVLARTEKNRVDRTVRRLYRISIDGRAATALYTPDDERSGTVRVELNEGGVKLLSLEIATASREESELICGNWKTRTAEIYADIFDLLLKPPEREIEQEQADRDAGPKTKPEPADRDVGPEPPEPPDRDAGPKTKSEPLGTAPAGDGSPP
jgi:hypothetical protein